MVILSQNTTAIHLDTKLSTCSPKSRTSSLENIVQAVWKHGLEWKSLTGKSQKSICERLPGVAWVCFYTQLCFCRVSIKAWSSDLRSVQDWRAEYPWSYSSHSVPSRGGQAAETLDHWKEVPGHLSRSEPIWGVRSITDHRHLVLFNNTRTECTFIYDYVHTLMLRNDQSIIQSKFNIFSLSPLRKSFSSQIKCFISNSSSLA